MCSKPGGLLIGARGTGDSTVIGNHRCLPAIVAVVVSAYPGNATASPGKASPGQDDPIGIPADTRHVARCFFICSAEMARRQTMILVAWRNRRTSVIAQASRPGENQGTYRFVLVSVPSPGGCGCPACTGRPQAQMAVTACSGWGR